LTPIQDLHHSRSFF